MKIDVWSGRGTDGVRIMICIRWWKDGGGVEGLRWTELELIQAVACDLEKRGIKRNLRFLSSLC